jgi:outer membrane beta-barrel protein
MAPKPIKSSALAAVALGMLSVWPGWALAQDQDDEEPAPATRQEGSPPVVLASPQGGAAADAGASPAVTAGADAGSGPDVNSAREITTNPAEHDVSLTDRVKSVQHKSFVMEHRLALSLDGTASVNDPFFQKWGGGGQLTYQFSDPFGLSAHFDYYGNQETDSVAIARQVLASEIYATRLKFLGGLDFVWTPIYGKLSTFNKIVHFNLYLLAGLGVADGEQGILPATEVGLGERIFFTDWFSAGLEGRYAFYVDAASGETSTLEKELLMSAVATFWIPVRGAEESR